VGSRRESDGPDVWTEAWPSLDPHAMKQVAAECACRKGTADTHKASGAGSLPACRYLPSTDGGKRPSGLTQLVPRWVFGLAAGLALSAAAILITAMKDPTGLLLLALGSWSAVLHSRQSPCAYKAEADFHGLVTSAAGCAGAALVLFAAAALSAGGMRSEAAERGAYMVLFLLFMLFGVWWFRR